MTKGKFFIYFFLIILLFFHEFTIKLEYICKYRCNDFGGNFLKDFKCRFKKMLFFSNWKQLKSTTEILETGPKVLKLIIDPSEQLYEN